MRDKDHLIKHGTIMLIATVFSGLFNYGYHIVMVRMLGPKEYGIFFSLLALYMIISLPAGTIQTIIAKYISSFYAQKQFGKISYLLIRFLKKLCSYLTILLVVYLFCSKFIAVYLNIPKVTPVVIIGFTVFFGLLFPVGYGAFQGLGRFAKLGLVQVLAAFFRIVFGVLLVWIGFGVNGALFGSFLAALIMAVIGIWFLKDMLYFRPFDKDIGKTNIYKYFIPVSITYICFAIITYIDAIVVKHYFPPLLAGYYSTVSMIGKAFLFIPMAFTGAMFPKVSSQHEIGKKTRYLLVKTIIYSLITAVVGIVMCNLFPNQIIRILMKSKDITPSTLSTIVPLLRIVGFAITPYGLICIVVNYNLARHKSGFLPLFIVGCIVQIALLILFHVTLFQVLMMILFSGFFILISATINPRFIIDKMRNKR